MQCLNCENDKFEIKSMRFTPEIKGVEVEVIVPAYICTRCHEPLMDDEQMNHLRRGAADKYRQLHQLLTSNEIIHYRTVLGMSQNAFANYLNVGEASVKRWETYYVQDNSQDEHIRLKCDEAHAEFNALQVSWKTHPPDEYNGNRRFSYELFKQAVSFLIPTTKSPLFLNKALFYADFLHYQLTGRSISGARYVHLDYGPCPDQYQNLYALLKTQDVLVPAGNHTLKSLKKADLTVFSDSEKEVLKLIAEKAKPDGGERLLTISHQEDAFKKTAQLQFISYKYSKKLKIEIP